MSYFWGGVLALRVKVPDFFPFPGRLSGRGRSGKAEGRVQCQWEFKINHMWKRAQKGPDEKAQKH